MRIKMVLFIAILFTGCDSGHMKHDGEIVVGPNGQKLRLVQRWGVNYTIEEERLFITHEGDTVSDFRPFYE